MAVSWFGSFEFRVRMMDTLSICFAVFGRCSEIWIAFEATRSFQPMPQDQVGAILAKTRSLAVAGKFELFKTTSHFDSTAKHPDWLGGDTPEVEELAPKAG